MKVFISWSGERSQALALALRDWLPLVLHFVDPWLSEADVAAGDRWAQEVAKELEASNFGIICVTPENIAAPWILFEAGALAKSIQGARVVPLLFGLEFSDISGPLAQFQAKKVEKADLGELIQSINHATDESVPDDRSKQLFTALWPEFETKVTSIPDQAPTEKHMRPQHEIIEELVAGVRGLDARFRDLEGSLSEQGPPARRRRMRSFHPMMLEELIHMAPGEGGDPIGLLMLAGALREDFPWLSEVLNDAYREIQSGDGKSARRAIDRLRQTLHLLGRGPHLEMFGLGSSSKEAHMMMRELPMMLDHFLDRFESRLYRTSTDPDEREPDQEGE